MRYIVTGAAGFIGSNLADTLVASGHEVVGVDCFTDYYNPAEKERNAHGLDMRRLDLAEDELDLAGVDGVFHLAAQAGVRSFGDVFPVYVRRNLLATHRVFEAAAVAGVRVVFASSSSVYGEAESYPTSEDATPQPISPYGITKLGCEQLARAYAVGFGLDAVALRYFTVYGPRQRPDMSIHRLCTAALTGAPFPRYGDGTQIREFTEVGDIVAGNLAAADRDVAPGTYCNLAGGSEITLNDLIDLVAELAGAPIAVEAHDAQPGDSFRNGGAIDRARRVLGWQPQVALRDGLARQLAWHRSIA